MKSGNDTNKKSVFIIDDSTEDLEVLGNALSKHYQRQFALDGKKALNLLASSEKLPDLILLDVIMPDMDGYEVCRVLKKDIRLSQIPVIFLSALSDAKDKVKAFENGGVDYIQKPFDLIEVNARVDTHIRLHDLQIALEKHNTYLNQLVDDKIKEISESQMATIFGLAKLAESRDDETGKHLKRVQTLCKLIAQKLSFHRILTADFINNLEKAAPLHDIGKVGIRDAILLKPQKLTPDEFEAMKQHTTIGANTLREVYEKYPNNYFIEIGIEVAQSHHEKWDGSGYPQGLIGDETPLSARIMTLADVYDALRSKRVYKDAFSHEKACKIILEERGKHFDPLIVDAFFEHEKEVEMVYAEETN